MKVLSLTTVFPNPSEPDLGLFVCARLSAIARQVELKMIAPVPLLDYSNPQKALFRKRAFPFADVQDGIEVVRPRWFYPPFGTPINALCLFARVYPITRKLRRSFAFDLIDAHFGYPDGVAAALLAMAFGVPFVVTLRGSEPVFAQRRSARVAIRWALRRVHRLIAVSSELMDFAIAMGAPADRCSVIPNGVDRELFYARDRMPLRAALGVAPGRRLIVAVGELVEAKGHQHVIDAAKGLLEAGLDIELRIVGRAARGGRSYERELRNQIAAFGLEGRIHLTGWADRPSLSRILCAADLFCLASYTEGWPNAVQEALACGTPVVCSRVGAIPQMVPSPDYGSIVPPRNSKALFEALRCGLERSWDREEIANWGRRRCWEDIARESVEVFHSALNEREICPAGTETL